MIRPPGLTWRGEFVERRAVQGNQDIRLVDDRRTDRFIGDDDAAVGCAAAHFRTVGREPGHFAAFHQGGCRDNFAGGQDALAAKTGQDN